MYLKNIFFNIYYKKTNREKHKKILNSFWNYNINHQN